MILSGKKKRTYEFYPYKEEEDLNVPVEHLEARSMEYEKQKVGEGDASKKTAEIPDLERHLCSGRGSCRTGDGRIR